MIANLDEQVARVFRLSPDDPRRDQDATDDRPDDARVRDAHSRSADDSAADSPRFVTPAAENDRRLDDAGLPVWLL